MTNRPQTKRQNSRVKGLDPAEDQGLFSFPDTYLLIGVDEVGVACLSGPVVAAAFARPIEKGVHYPSAPEGALVADSKVLSESQRKKTLSSLKKASYGFWGLGQASVLEIDRLNILHASGLAQLRAVRDLWNHLPEDLKSLPCGIVVDGNRVSHFWRELEMRIPAQVKAVVKADAKHFVVAAASIQAKDFRDDHMSQLAKSFPDFGWEQNVGYPTPLHKEVLERLGPTPHHRYSFAPVREAVSLHGLCRVQSSDESSTENRFVKAAE